MNKYKIIGSLNILLGVIQMLGAVIVPVVMLSKLSGMYEAFGIDPGPSFAAYIVLITIFILGALYTFIGIKCFSSSKNRNKYFLAVCIVVASTPVLIGILTGILNLMVLTPIYKLSSNF